MNINIIFLTLPPVLQPLRPFIIFVKTVSIIRVCKKGSKGTNKKCLLDRNCSMNKQTCPSLPAQCQRASCCWFLHIRWCSQDRILSLQGAPLPQGHSATFTFSAACANSFQLHTQTPAFTSCTGNPKYLASARLPSSLCAHTAMDTLPRQPTAPCSSSQHTGVGAWPILLSWGKRTLTILHTRTAAEDNTTTGFQCSQWPAFLSWTDPWIPHWLAEQKFQRDAGKTMKLPRPGSWTPYREYHCLLMDYSVWYSEFEICHSRPDKCSV